MGTLCVKQPAPEIQYAVQEINFTELFQKELIGPNGNYFQLLNFLKQTDIKCLVYTVKALFHPPLKKKIVDLIVSLAEQIDTFRPPVHLLKLIQQRETINKDTQKAKGIIVVKQISPTTKVSVNINTFKDADEVKSRSSCPIENLMNENLQKYTQYLKEGNTDLRRKEQEIEDRLEKLSEALRGAQRAYEVEKQCFDQQSQAPQSFISKVSKRSLQRTMRNITDKSERMYATSFLSSSPKNNTLTKKSLEEITLEHKKSFTNKQITEEQNYIQLQNKMSKEIQIRKQNDEFSEPESVVDKHMAIRDFYENQISKYKQQLEQLRNRLVISQKENQSEERSNFSSLVSKESKKSIVNRERNATMTICSAQVNQEITETIHETMEYGTRMTKKYDSHISQDSQSNDSNRKHTKSLLIRLFRDSKMFQIDYSKRSSPIRFMEIRQKIERVFSAFYTEKVYMRNPIERTNMIFLFEERQPKKYYDYLKDYKTWILIGKVNDNLCIGAFINLKSGLKSSTQESFLFSLPREGSSYILRAKTKIMDPLIKPDFINFGDSEFRIRSGTKKVNLGLENLNMSFCEEDGGEPNARRFTMGHGENIELLQLEIHQVVFEDDCM